MSLLEGQPPYVRRPSRVLSIGAILLGVSILATPWLLADLIGGALRVPLIVHLIFAFFGGIFILVGVTYAFFYHPTPVDPIVSHPALGQLTYDARDKSWRTTLTLADRSLTVEIAPTQIDGVYVPDPQLLEHASHIVGNFPTFEKRINEFLRTEAALTTLADCSADVTELQAELSEDILQLQIAAICLWRPPNNGMIYFTGSEELSWRCGYCEGQPLDLGFDD